MALSKIVTDAQIPALVRNADYQKIHEWAVSRVYPGILRRFPRTKICQADLETIFIESIHDFMLRMQIRESMSIEPARLLYVICRNKLCTFWRVEKRIFNPGFKTEIWPQAISGEHYWETVEAVGFCLDRLPPGKKNVLHDFYFEDLNMIEISIKRNMTVNSVKTTTYQGRKMFKAMWLERIAG